MEVPKQIQDKVTQFQGIQNQLQMIMVQKNQSVIKLKSIETALTEVEKVAQERIYNVVGPLVIETNKEDSKTKLEKDKETTDTEIKILDRQEKRLKDKLNELNVELQAMMQGGEGGISAG